MHARKGKTPKDPMPFHENPFVNDKLYPIAGVITSTFLDTHLQRNIQSFTDGYLPNYVNPNTEYSNFLGSIQRISEETRQFSDALNDNQMAEFKNLWIKYQEWYEKQEEKPYKNPKDFEINENDSKNPISKECIEQGKALAQDFYISLIKPHFLKSVLESCSDVVNKHIMLYNASHKFSSIFIDTAEFVCIHKKYGLLVHPVMTPNLYPYEYEAINKYQNETFKAIEAYKKIKTDAVYVIYFNLVLNINNRPLGLLFSGSDPFGNPVDVDYFNSDEVIDMIEQGILGNNLNDNWEDFNDDDDDEDDDI